jgi:LuxR family transcriptional regulator, maltose regulon positive regulatory protein
MVMLRAASEAGSPAPQTSDVLQQRSSIAGSLLHTKLFAPSATPTLLSRPRLNRALASQPGGSLALVCAPAGYGKTTLVCDYLHQQSAPAAWLTLDVQDNDPVLFWRYLVAALQSAMPELGLQAQAMLAMVTPLSLEPVVTSIINDIASGVPANGRLTLVLDDFHWIQTAAIFQSLNFLLQHQPRQLRLVLLTRSDPPLSLARLRVEGRLVELRARELRLTLAEIETLLNDIMSLALPQEPLQQLAEQTEGWAAGLQLAALSLRRNSDAIAARLLERLAGADEHVFAYLVEEVLGHQPEDVRRFVQQTAMLRQFCAPLCAAVTGREDAATVLNHLLAENLFVTPLDDRGHWYRYHPLFAETVRAHLPQAELQLCHRRAANWYAGQQLWPAALRNALAAADYELAASLLTRTYKIFLGDGLLASLQQWLAALPDEFRSPRLRLASAWSRVYESNEAELQAVVDEIEAAAVALDAPFRGEVLAVRAIYASLYGDLDQSIRMAGEALPLIAPDDYLSRAAAYHALGNSYRYQGELDAALAAYGQARRQFAALGNVFMAQLPLYRSAHIQILQGRLHQAQRTYQSVRQLAQEAGHEPVMLSGEIFGYLSELYCEWNELDQAATYAQQEIELAQRGPMRLALVDGYLKLATASAAQGDPDRAREALLSANEVATSLHSVPVTAQIALAQARFDLDCGNLEAAAAWAGNYASQQGKAACALTPLAVQTADLLLARIRLAQGRGALALQLLQEALPAIEATGRTRLVVEANILQALAWTMLKQPSAASKALIRALATAKAEDYVRVFIENGPVLVPLLQQVHHLFPSYVDRLVSAMTGASPSERKGGETQPYEPLTAREAEIVALIARGCSNLEIAQTLVLSVGTVKGHINHIFGKLSVRNRTQAVLRARELGLLDS